MLRPREARRVVSKFLFRLLRSQGAVNRVAWWLFKTRNNKSVRVGGYNLTEGYDPDGGDLLIDDKIRGEVKHVDASFTCASDWPFGLHFIVDAVDAFDGKRDKPHYYFCVSRNRKHMAIVDVDATREGWYVEDRRSKLSGQEKPYYFIRTWQVKEWIKL